MARSSSSSSCCSCATAGAEAKEESSSGCQSENQIPLNTAMKVQIEGGVLIVVKICLGLMCPSALKSMRSNRIGSTLRSRLNNRTFFFIMQLGWNPEHDRLKLFKRRYVRLSFYFFFLEKEANLPVSFL
jgi:hypothetical protein